MGGLFSSFTSDNVSPSPDTFQIRHQIAMERVYRQNLYARTRQTAIERITRQNTNERITPQTGNEVIPRQIVKFSTEELYNREFSSQNVSSFKPLKDRYFGPNLDGFFYDELISRLSFSGWNEYNEYNHPNIVDVPLYSAEGKAVIGIFSKNAEKLTVTGIRRVENMFLYAMYSLKKEEMMNRNGHVDVLNLFHGTKKANVQLICNNNFNWRKHGDNVGNRFGQGVSFSPKAMYASHYCDQTPDKVMFLVKVLVSKAIIGNPNMIVPTGKSPNGKVWHNDTSVKPNNDVVVKYGDNEFYPAYTISFIVS